MLLADPRIDTARTFIVRLNADTFAGVMAVFGELEADGRAALSREFGEGTVSIEREAEMRYRGQHHSIKLAVGASDDAAALRARFDREYLRRYGHANATAEVEIVVLHSLATLHMKRPEIARLARAPSGDGAPEPEVRPVFFLEEDKFLPARIHDRYRLPAGFTGAGPAVIVEYGSSTLIGPGDKFSIGKLGEIDIDCRH
jgi:N-methylhydantoinase A